MKVGWWLCVCVYVCTCMWTDTQSGVAEGQVRGEKRGNDGIQRLQLRVLHLLHFFPLRNELLLHLKTYNLYYEGQNLQLRHREVRSPRGRPVGRPDFASVSPGSKGPCLSCPWETPLI